MAKIRTTDAEAIATAIERGEKFDTHGSLSGQPETYGARSYGYIPREHIPSLLDADYVIYSYATPIAWRTQGQWITPDVKYSVTTSKQQGVVRRALRYLDVVPV